MNDAAGIGCHYEYTAVFVSVQMVTIPHTLPIKVQGLSITGAPTAESCVWLAH